MKYPYDIFPPLREDQLLMLNSVTRIVDDVVEPRAAEIDRTGEFPHDIKDLFAEQGLFGLPIGEEYGGLGESLLMMALVLEEISRACFSSAMIVGAIALSVYPMDILASSEQKQKYYPTAKRPEKTFQ